MKRLVEDFGYFSLKRIIDANDLRELNMFVLYNYYNHHLKHGLYPEHELVQMINEDSEAFSHSLYYVICDSNNELVGSIKLQEWDHKKLLCIQYEFDVDLFHFIDNLDNTPNKVFHIGRFAIDQEKIKSNKELRKRRLTILKLLMYHALLPVMANSSNIFFCECDEKLCSKLNLMGVYPEIIGKPKLCMGSMTIPIYCDNSRIQDFFHKQKKLSYVS
ncbi:hypothetical protein [Draconibacterium orientale]|uniref:hypothetical protein n=1 Tax=Draconibacterium orientale TaxID=1168034 RepID=UPI0029C0F650|nr:hypothetical protein [Draconibacterium orientale]